MKLKFIGTDGSMGLRHGEVYNVKIISRASDRCIIVEWPIGVFKTRSCPYSSLAAFVKNWSDYKELKK